MKCLKCHVENPDDSRFCGRCGAPFGPEDAAFSLTKTIATPIPVPARDALIAGKYKIVEELGRGGMGVVFKAEDLKLNRCVALKFLPPHLSESAELKERFLIEARAAAALSHPNICVIHEVGEDVGRPFIAMEYVEGETLRDRIKRDGVLPAGDALAFAGQVAAGLGEAHAKGIIHRDIKSANIMVTEKGRAKVMDFGLAKLRGGSSLTRTQTTLGTVAYMSPEQARGDELDPRTDIWSLGIVLCEMLTGEPPFKGDHDQTVIHAILHKEPKPPSQIKDGLPVGMDGIVLRALAKRTGDRYQTMEEFQGDVEAVAEGLKPLRARPVRRIFGIRAAHVGSAAAAVLAILIGVNVGGVRDRILGRTAPLAPALRLAVLPFVNIAGDAEQDYLSDGLTQEMISQLGRLNPSGLNVIARSSVMRYKKGDTPIDQVGRELGVEYVLEGSTRHEGGQVRITAELIKVEDQTQLWTKTYEREVSGLLTVQSEVAQNVADALALKLLPEEKTRLTSARTVNPEVYDAYLKGMFYVSQNTQESFDKGMKILHQAVEIDPAEPLAYLGLAEGYITLGHGGAELHDAFKRARAAAEQALKLDQNMAEAVGALAHVALYYEWDWEKAERLFKQALELNPSVAMTHYHYAWYLPLVDRLDEAIEHHKIARDLDPLRPLHTAWLGGLYNYAGRFDEAIVEANKALELNPKFGPSFNVLCAAYLCKNMPDEAIAAALRLKELLPEEGNAFLCMAYVSAGRREEALEISSMFEKDTLRFLTVSQAYLALGDKDEAFRVLESAYEAHRATLPWIRVHWKAGGGFEAVYDDPRFQDLLRRMNLSRPSRSVPRKGTI
ncbi:MAG: protein kinase [Acidobacteriota bacterium]|nr:protein kinase [Acidobacteriota bacterium]